MKRTEGIRTRLAGTETPFPRSFSNNNANMKPGQEGVDIKYTVLHTHYIKHTNRTPPPANKAAKIPKIKKK